MKKLYFVLFLLMSIAQMQVYAQTNCNANFTTSLQPGGVVNFAPANTTGSHLWNFGDGSISSTVSPSHTYFNNGTYTVLHRLYVAMAGTVVCMDSSIQSIVIQNAFCNLQAQFTVATATAPNSFSFTNTSINASSTDSVRWTFGDGTSANTYNATHVYSNPGIYNVCLRIIKRNPNGLLTNCVSEVCHPITIVSSTTCTLTSSFTYTNPNNTGSTPGTFYFINTSLNAAPTDSIRWTFGDGTSANTYNAVHTYANQGTYNVCLRIIKRNTNGVLTNCIKESCQTIVVTAPPICTLLAAFTVSHDSTSSTPNVFHFNNTSTGAASTDSIRWTFGDGTSSNVYSPSHAYANYGAYNVCLRIIKRNPNGTLTNCIREICYYVFYNNPNPCFLNTSFNSVLTPNTLNPFTYYFNNTSTGAALTDSIRWTFGDGTSANTYNATHSYANAGTYTVCLRIIKRNSNGVLTNCIKESCQTITVTPAGTCNLVAAFTFTQGNTSTTNNVVNFTNTSLNAVITDSIRWTFGDGTSTPVYSPSHTYTSPGTYNVCLRIIKRNPNGLLTNCVKEVCHVVSIGYVSNCNFQAYFANAADTSDFRKIYFQNLTAPMPPGATTTWTFGDGQTASIPNPVHVYANAGTYNVCLRVAISASCVREYCKLIVVQPGSCANAQVTYVASHINGAPNWYHFQAMGSMPITQQVWKITKLPQTPGTTTVTLNQNNPNYLFTDTGNYRVCLIATLGPNCVKEYCSTIHVGTPNPTLGCIAHPYPNPAQNIINADVVLAVAQPITIKIYNNTNTLMLQQTTSGVAGFNTVTANIQNLLPGIYYIKVIHGNDVCSNQFVKL